MEPSDWDYRGLAAESYDLWFGEEPFFDQAFFAGRIRERGGTALEIACGTGRLLLPYLRDGLPVEGLDASREMLDLCQRKAAAKSLAPVLHHQRMQEIALERRYRTLFVPSCSFQILAHREEAMEALRRFRAHLEPDGELLVSLYVPWRDMREGRRWRLRRSGLRPGDGARVMIHEATQADRVEQVMDWWLRLELYRDGRLEHSELREHRLRWYHVHEFALMLEAAGYQQIERTGYTGSAPRDPDSEWVVSARA